MSRISSDPTHLTKDRLRSELQAHDIPLPAPDARKDTLVKLYLKHLSPLRSVESKNSPKKSEFSSDEEDQSPIRRTQKRVTKRTRVITRNDDIEVEKAVANLSDRELAEELKELGVSVGPILDSTRSVYERKLVRLRTDGPQETKVNNESDQYSDSDDEDVSSKEDSQDSDSNTRMNLRKRTTRTTQQESVEDSKKEITVTTTTKTEEITTQSATEQISDTKTHVTTTQVAPKKKWVPVYIQVLILIAVAIFIFFVLYNMEKLPQRKIPESLPSD